MPPKKVKGALQSADSDVMEVDSEQVLCHRISIDAQLQMLLAEEKTDCKIKCQGLEWNLHQAVVCRRCEYFKRVFNGQFQEAISKTLNWEKEEPWAIEALLIYIYTSSYPKYRTLKAQGLLPEKPGASNTVPTTDGSISKSDLEKAGQKDAGSLGDRTDDNAATSMTKLKVYPPTTSWEVAIGIFKIAERYSLDFLRKLAAKRLTRALKDDVGEKSYVHLLQQVWVLEGRGSEELQDAVIDAACQNVGHLLEDDQFDALLEKTSQFARCLLDKMHEKCKCSSKP